MPDYTTTALLASIRRRAGAPNSTAQGTTDADLLLIATEELKGEVTSFLRRVNENHLLDVYEVALVAGTDAYFVPQRAIGGTLKDATIKSADGTYRNLRYMDIDQLPQLQGLSGEPARFYFRDQKLVLHPAPTASGDTLYLPYFRRCSDLVLTTAVGTISSVAGQVITCSASLPGTFTLTKKYDIVKASPPFGIVAMDLSPSSVGATSVTFSSGVPASGVTAGDYLCLANESPVPNVPEELHQFLAACSAVELLAGPYGDLEQLEAAVGKMNRMRDEILPDLLKDRNPGEKPFLANPYFFGSVANWEDL